MFDKLKLIIQTDYEKFFSKHCLCNVGYEKIDYVLIDFFSNLYLIQPIQNTTDTEIRERFSQERVD